MLIGTLFAAAAVGLAVEMRRQGAHFWGLLGFILMALIAIGAYLDTPIGVLIVPVGAFVTLVGVIIWAVVQACTPPQNRR